MNITWETKSDRTYPYTIDMDGDRNNLVVCKINHPDPHEHLSSDISKSLFSVQILTGDIEQPYLLPEHLQFHTLKNAQTFCEAWFLNKEKADKLFEEAPKVFPAIIPTKEMTKTIKDLKTIYTNIKAFGTSNDVRQENINNAFNKLWIAIENVLYVFSNTNDKKAESIKVG